MTTPCPDTSNIPGRLLLSRACFRFLLVQQSYRKRKAIGARRLFIRKEMFTQNHLKMSKEKKKQKKKNTQEWAIAHRLLIRFSEASGSRHIIVGIRYPNTTTFTTC